MEKEYPFSISDSAIQYEYPADNMYALTSIIRDTIENQNVWICEFSKNSDIEEAKEFAFNVKASRKIVGCCKAVDVGAANARYFENDEYFYIYMTFENSKNVTEICVYGIDNVIETCIDGEIFFYSTGAIFEIDQREQIKLRTIEFNVKVDDQFGTLAAVQQFNSATNEWKEIETKFTPDRLGIF